VARDPLHRKEPQRTVARRPPDRARPTTPTTAPLVVVALALLATLLGAPVALADPIVPPGANDTVRALAEANGRAEGAAERAMDTAEQLPIRQAEGTRTLQVAAQAGAAAGAAGAERDRAFLAVDALTRSSYQSGDLDQLGALLASGSPQAYLDKISLLDTISTENRAILQRFLDAAAAADAAQRDADAQALDARRASDDAERTARDARTSKVEADRDVAAAEAASASASAADRAALRGPGITNYPANIPGAGLEVAALRMALTQQGKPYVWGATGPVTYDCSGLVQWAYRQVGVGLPRVARAQQQVGQAVNPTDIQVGDLIFFDDPATHVGIFVGNGRFLEAPQSGDVVKVAPIRGGVSSIRRIAL